MLNISYLSLPVFSIVMVVEIIINQRENLGLYKKQDAVFNIFSGLVLLLIGIFFKFIAIIFFQWVYQFRLMELQNSIWVIIVACLSCDLIYYLFHRLGHVCRLFWINHVVHHSSKYFNYSVGIRNHFMHLSYRFLFWAPLCFIGFDPFLVIFIDNCTNLYQFLLHTQLIGKLGPLEWVFNTPSHHRVHHASNKQYIDKNLGGFLIIYDRLFGTFCKENEKPVYGITKEIKSSHPVNLVFHEYWDLMVELRKTKSILTKLKILLANPSKTFN